MVLGPIFLDVDGGNEDILVTNGQLRISKCGHDHKLMRRKMPKGGSISNSETNVALSGYTFNVFQK